MGKSKQKQILYILLMTLLQFTNDTLCPKMNGYFIAEAYPFGCMTFQALFIDLITNLLR